MAISSTCQHAAASPCCQSEDRDGKHGWMQFESFCDDEGRRLTLHASTDTDLGGFRSELETMYSDYDTQHRASGLPPGNEEVLATWLDRLEGEHSHHLVAVHGGVVVGHAMLVADGSGAHEFAVFVRGAYHGAGIGRTVSESLLEVGAQRDVDDVWLVVERDNVAAVRCCEKSGFERAGRRHQSFLMRTQLEASPGAACSLLSG